MSTEVGNVHLPEESALTGNSRRDDRPLSDRNVSATLEW